MDGGHVAVTAAVVDGIVGALIDRDATTVCCGPSAVEHIANAVALSSISNWPAKPPNAVHSLGSAAASATGADAAVGVVPRMTRPLIGRYSPGPSGGPE